MNKKFLSFAAMAAIVAVSFTACDDDDDPAGSNGVEVKSIDIYTSGDTANVTAWGNYMTIVGKLLVTDATTLYTDWTVKGDNISTSYADWFKSQDALESFDQIVEGCKDIANEVGEAKIGDPLNYWEAAQYTKAVLAVESWYSWHSRDDYSNNILSIRNSYYGSLDGSVAETSISALVKAVDADLDTKVVDAINNAYNKILAIPQPFRNNINSDEAKAAQSACAELNETLSSLKAAGEKLDKAKLAQAITDYVDDVVLPTYKNLVAGNTALLAAAQAFAKAPSAITIEACAVAWLAARQPWETSEAFLFGPVSDRGLDPNMDSWPLDQDGIENLIKSGKFDDLDWEGDYDEDDEDIAAKQALRGFHTMEFLIFKDGKARSIY